MRSAEFIAFTEADYKRLSDISALYSSPFSTFLREELSRGYVLDSKSIPRGLITMNSTVRFMDLFTGTVRRVTLVYPNQANPENGRISVLSSLGVALIGMSVGQEVYWRKAQGNRVQLRVLKVEYQPEAAGHWNL